jgi:hypothetical protein
MFRLGVNLDCDLNRSVLNHSFFILISDVLSISNIISLEGV